MADPTQPIHLCAVTRKPRSPSFEQRVLRFIEPLRAAGIAVEPRVLPKGQLAQRRFLRELRGFDAIWWHRHLLAPWWPPRLRRAARVLVMDYDDPLPYSAGGGGRPSLTRRMRFAAMVRRCDAVLTASDHLRELAAPYCRNVTVMPMAIDVPAEPPALSERAADGTVELLWLGSRPTQPYLELIRAPLEALGRRRRDVRLRLVAHEPMSFAALVVDHRPWSPAEQEAALRECHLGLCPMPDTVWTRGKCPFKVLQYMATGMPWIGSAVGENIASAGDGARGICAGGDEAWSAAMDALIDDVPRRRAMGEAGHAWVREHHDRAVLTGRLVRFWREAIQDSGFEI